MIDVWGMVYHHGVWVSKVIGEYGVEYRYIYDNNVIILPYDSTIAREWVKNPEPYLKKLFNIDADRITASVTDLTRRYSKIVYEKDGKTYTRYCSSRECFTIDGSYEELPTECPSADGYTEVPHLAHTYVKPGKGYLNIKRCIKTPDGLKVLLAKWRPGTYITRTFAPGEEAKPPEYRWAMYNDVEWYRDETGIHAARSPMLRDDEIDPLFVLDAPSFSVLHDGNNTDWIITPYTRQKIKTGAKTPEELFWKVFTGKYVVL